MMSEVSRFDHRAVVHMDVVAPDTESDDFAGIGVSTPALAMETRLLSLSA
jgi:hypothetical protein